MKCKSWSNKINNFVVRRLKSIKINGQPQPQQQSTTQQQQQQQQQYLSTCSSTMPAMPKEKHTAVSLTESFSELKLKELATSATATATVVAATAAAAMASTTTTRLQQQQHSTCGCGASSAADIVVANSISNGRNGNNSSSSSSNINNTSNSNKYMTTNGHSSPLTAAVAAQQQQQQQIATTILPQQRNSSCCRMRQQQQNGNSGNSSEQQQQQVRSNMDGTTTTVAVGNGSVRVPYLTVPVAIAGSASGSVSTSSSSSCSSSTAAAVTPPKKSPKDFFFGKYIGEGSFSNVYLAVDVNTKREYAIKVCEKRHILREHKQEYIRREREVMHTMTNIPGFVNLSCTFQDNRSLYFVMTYAKNGDLLPYINKVGSFDVDCTRHYAAELVLACEQMHRRNVVHRDLKPENILLDEDMHTLIADFGSAKILTPEDRAAARAAAAAVAATMATKTGAGTATFGTAATLRQSRAEQMRRGSIYDVDVDEDDNNTNDDEDDIDGGGGDSTNDTGSDDVDSPSRSSGGSSNNRRHQQQQGRYFRKRMGSFVGTAQYVSPEVLRNVPITPSADLWALGCIIYQMISGLPPFRGSNDYVIFKDILACNIDFPQGFDRDAEDLVRRLLIVDPAERLGARDIIEGTTAGCYDSLRAHPFFASVDFTAVRSGTPPPIYPYLPGVSKDEEFRSHYRVPENLETGLDDKQLTRLLGMELGTALCGDSGGVELQHQQQNGGSNVSAAGMEIEKKTVIKNIFDLSDAEKQRRLEQQKSDKWHVFADNEVILKNGYINKRKGLFARKRMLLLTTGPRLIYIDPVQMIKKGEIPWSAELRVEPKNFKIFFVHTPNRTYYLEDPEGYSLEWVEAIENMRKLTYKDQTKATTTSAAAAITTGKNSLSATTKTTSHALAASAAGGTMAISKTASN